MYYETVILGGGVTGLASGLASGYPVFEARDVAGGICSSYYMRPGERTRLPTIPDEDEVYRFEYGGGHWIFGGDPAVLRFIKSLTPVRLYQRCSAVFFAERELYVPYPLQNHLSYIGKEIAVKAIAEMAEAPRALPATMAEWLEQSFGPTLMEKFFAPFHELYTAGLWTQIAPQDAYKSPAKLPLVIQGALDEAPPVGYNITFVYPNEGLNTLAGRMADRCDIRYGKQVMKVDPHRKLVEFADGATVSYDRLLSTLPLNHMCEMAGLLVDAEPDPYTSVLVVNIGAARGPRCPDYHWLYVPVSRTRFHRVGFYSNVDRIFLPGNSRETGDRVSIYVERAYRGGHKPGDDEIAILCQDIVQELQDWGFLGETEVVDPTWIDVAYTWSWPDSKWKQLALSILEQHDIHQVGRYGRWVFQGIADSIRDGFIVGAAI